MRPGRKVDINYPDLGAITVRVLGTEKTTRVLPVEGEITEDGELVPHRRQRLVQFYSDLGWRTVALAHITVR